jgi:hypothetical protein
MTEWFHGGYPGLAVGDWIEPPDVTGTEHRVSAYVPEGAPHGQRTDVVYLTNAGHVARFYAAVYPDGAIYRVAPAGVVGPDPDAPNDAVMCGRAQVLEVVRPRVVFAHRTWESWVRLLENGGGRG